MHDLLLKFASGTHCIYYLYTMFMAIVQKGGIFLSCRVLPFPSQVNEVYTSIFTFLKTKNGRQRQIMLLNIRALLDEHHISHYNYGSFSVHCTADKDIAYIYGKQRGFNKYCPQCKSYLYSADGPVTILSIIEGIKTDRVTYGCNCGAIFYKWEKK